MNEVQHALKQVIKDNFHVDVNALLTRPEEKFGDFTSNVALQLAGQLGQSPKNIAEQISDAMPKNKYIFKTEVAGPGFINITLSDDYFIQLLSKVDESYGSNQKYAGKTVVTEYLDPNLFKELHVGHAYSGTIGDAISSLLEVSGAKVHRVTYQGDIGLHVAKALYGMNQKIDDPEQLGNIPSNEHASFLAGAYVLGATAYEEDAAAQRSIDDLNVRIYQMDDPQLKNMYDTGKQWSLEYFKQVYKKFGFTPFEKNYMESRTANIGTELVKKHLGTVFEESHGAIIFKGEDHGLHTRVFINSKGLPTYEAKDLGLPQLKQADFNPDISVIITANEQSQYFDVMLKALQQFEPTQASMIRHIAHGIIKLSSGKMSSRTGQVVRAVDLLENVEKAIHNLTSDESIVRDAATGAIKYTFLKSRIGGDITFDVNQSVSLEGNSGPYLQYSYARAKSVVHKAGKENVLHKETGLEVGERSLLRKISQYPDVVSLASEELMPHYVATYLYELAQNFNRFYEKSRIIGDPRQDIRIGIVKTYAQVLQNGLKVLNIPTPSKM